MGPVEADVSPAYTMTVEHEFLNFDCLWGSSLIVYGVSYLGGGSLEGLFATLTLDGVEQAPPVIMHYGGSYAFIVIEFVPNGYTVVVTIGDSLTDVVPITFTYDDGCAGVCEGEFLADAGDEAYVFTGPYSQPCVTLQGTVIGGVPYEEGGAFPNGEPYPAGGYHFQFWGGSNPWDWSYSNTSHLEVCPTQDTYYTLRVQDARGCIREDQVLVRVIDTQCQGTGNNTNKVTMCINGNTMCINVNAVEPLLANNPGASLGPCTKSLLINYDEAITTAPVLKLFPNPNDGQLLTFNAEGLEEEIGVIAIDMFDMYGRKILSRQLSVQNGSINTTLSFDHTLAPGMYLVNIIAGGQQFTERLIVQP
jgi:hypothetical protein